MLRQDPPVIFPGGAAVRRNILQRLHLPQAWKKAVQLRPRQNRAHGRFSVDRRIDRAAVVIRAEPVIIPIFIQSGHFQPSRFLDHAYAFYTVNDIFTN